MVQIYMIIVLPQNLFYQNPEYSHNLLCQNPEYSHNLARFQNLTFTPPMAVKPGIS